MTPPPPWSAARAGSFAWDTVKRRMPDILADTRARLFAVPAEVDAALGELAAELRAGPLRGLREPSPDRGAWDAACAPHVGRPWLQLPWYFAESFFYRRIVEATGWFGSGALAGVDPFASHKAEEWVPDQGPRRVAELLAAAPAGGRERTRALLLGSLWGNRADLSYNVAKALGAFIGEADDLLVDDADAVVAHLLDSRRERVVVIADNAGTECLMDLALVDHLVTELGVARVDFDVKNHPFFVSDTVPGDIDAALAALAGSGRDEAAALHTRLVAHLGAGRIVVRTHPFYTSSAFFPALPADLRADLAAADLVVIKGDANYRRLASDAPWPPTTPFAEVIAEVPGKLVALRTLKAEVIVGLPLGKAEALAAADPRWMVNGRRGVIQARLA